METFAPGLSFGLVDGRPVFMDEGGDSYFLLEPEQEAEFLTLLSTSGARRQVSAGLCRALNLPAQCQTLSPAQCLAAERSLLDGPRLLGKTRLIDVLKLWRTLHLVRRSLKQRPIQALLNELRTSDPPDGEMSLADRLMARALDFAAARRAVPIAPNCLADSLALLVWLGPTRNAATLVFGVKLDPFAAHCWVQSGAILLNDRVDEIARFQPVRAVTCSPATR